MKKIKLTNDEIKFLNGALNYYVYEASHVDDIQGLPEGKELRLLKSVLRKIQEDSA